MNILSRFELAEYFNKQGYKVGAEVGVFDGSYSKILCDAIPNLKLYCVDPWTVYKGYRDHKFTTSMQRAEDKARETLAPYNCHFIKDFSVEAAKTFADESLDFVYIDGNHEYDYVKQDIEAWAPKVRKGGIVSGHDYYAMRSGNRGVIDAVNEYTNKHGIALHIIPRYRATEKDDHKQPNWYFVR